MPTGFLSRLDSVAQGVQCVAYSPLGSASLMVPNDLKERPAVMRVANETGKTPSQACGDGGYVLIRAKMVFGSERTVSGAHRNGP